MTRPVNGLFYSTGAKKNEGLKKRLGERQATLRMSGPLSLLYP